MRWSRGQSDSRVADGHFAPGGRCAKPGGTFWRSRAQADVGGSICGFADSLWFSRENSPAWAGDTWYGWPGGRTGVVVRYARAYQVARGWLSFLSQRMVDGRYICPGDDCGGYPAFLDRDGSKLLRIALC